LGITVKIYGGFKMDKEYLNVDDIAKILNIHRVTALNMFNKGRLPGRKLANRWIISKDQFKKYVERNDEE
jgi:excisionase family DNA binding protein